MPYSNKVTLPDSAIPHELMGTSYTQTTTMWMLELSFTFDLHHSLIAPHLGTCGEEVEKELCGSTVL